jgi:uroporphyrinogen decarboxylase
MVPCLPMTPSENLRRAVRFEKPDWIPMTFHINPACWNRYPHDALQELMVDHPLLFPGFQPVERVEPRFSPVQLRDHPYTDGWGCIWETTEDGITGTVHRHPLADWNDFETYEPPDPEISNGLVPVDWDGQAGQMRAAKARGELVQAGLRHGHTFLQLIDIRGYENLMFDMADEEPRLWKLIELIETFNLALIDRYIELGADWIGYAEDLGMQVGPMLSPDHFRKYIKPSYQRLMAPAREKSLIVHMHSDGDIRTLVDDLIDGGVEVINLQDLVNGIDWIADQFAGKVCIDLDIDRQDIVPRGTPEQIDALIREEVEKLSTPRGGLMMIHGMYPGEPLENAKALMDAMEKYAGYHS